MEKQPPFRIGQFIVEPERFSMREGGQTIDVSKRLMQLLTFLAAHPGEVVTKEELLTNIWPGVMVSDDTIRKSISDLRILFQQHDGSIEIESIRGVGYRLLSPVEAVSPQLGVGNVQLLWFIGFLMAFALMALSYWSVMEEQVQIRIDNTLNRTKVTTALRWSADEETMTFVQQIDSKQQLQIKEKGKRELPIMESATALRPEAAFSPDGKALIYLDRQGADKILKLRQLEDQREVDLQQLAQTPALSSLDWCTDGQLIVWSEAKSGRPYQLYTSAPIKMNKTALTYPPADYIGDMQARFSPSGEQLCFIRYSSPVATYEHILPGLGQLYVKELGSGAEIPLLEREMVLGGVEWLNEHTLAYIARDFYTFGIHTINLQTREKKTIYTSARALRHLENWQDMLWTEQWQENYSFLQFLPASKATDVAFGTALKCWHPAYSPDGTQLVYVTKGEQAYELRLRDTESGEENVLFAAPMLIQSPQWSPRGDALVFMLEGSEAGVCTIELANRRITPLTKGEYPNWSTGGDAVHYVSLENGLRQVYRQPTSVGSEAEALFELPAKRVWVYEEDWLFSHESEPGLWLYDSGTQAIRQLLPDFEPADTPNWLLLGHDLYYWSRDINNTPTLHRFDLQEGISTVVHQLGKDVPHDYSGFAVQPGTGAILFPAEQQVENRLIPIPVPEDQ